MNILSVEGLCKNYPGFSLDNVSFSLEEGSIMGFIGRNGAGKTTTLKSILGLVHPDSGSVKLCGVDYAAHEAECRRQTGIVFGEVDYYQTAKLRDVAAVTKRFYPDWDDGYYSRLLRDFSLDENKRVRELSAGMRVKFSLAMALAHRPKLLLLDEPTSGLDPVSRDELIGIFLSIVRDGERSILFSTHIISDLEKCADAITYIKGGRILHSLPSEEFLDSYRLVSGGSEELTEELKDRIIGLRQHAFGFEGLLPAEKLGDFPGLSAQVTDMENIMVHIEREAEA